MSLERKDIRLKVTSDMHAMVQILAEVSDVEIAEYVESILSRFVNDEITKSMIVASRMSRLGIAGKIRE